MSRSDSEPIETIRVSSSDRRRVLNDIETAAKKATVNDERRDLRVNLDLGGIVIEVTHANGAMNRFIVIPRNVSRRGVAFLHGQFIYPESRTDVTLPTLDGRRLEVSGRIARCRHVSGLMHEVSVVFDESIDVRQVARLDDEQLRLYERECELTAQAAG